MHRLFLAAVVPLTGELTRVFTNRWFRLHSPLLNVLLVLQEALAMALLPLTSGLVQVRLITPLLLLLNLFVFLNWLVSQLAGDLTGLGGAWRGLDWSTDGLQGQGGLENLQAAQMVVGPRLVASSTHDVREVARTLDGSHHTSLNPSLRRVLRLQVLRAQLAAVDSIRAVHSQSVAVDSLILLLQLPLVRLALLHEPIFNLLI